MQTQTLKKKCRSLTDFSETSGGGKCRKGPATRNRGPFLSYKMEDCWGKDHSNGTQVNVCWAKLMVRSLLGNPELK